MAAEEKELTIGERWEKGIPHDKRSVALYKSISDIDFKEGGDRFCFKDGGDGDNGEHLMYLLDIHFARKDRVIVIKEEGTPSELIASTEAIERIK